MEQAGMLKISSRVSESLNAKASKLETNAADVMLRVVSDTQRILRSEPAIKARAASQPDLTINRDAYTFYHSGTF